MASSAQQGAAPAALSSSDSIRSLQRETPKQQLLHQHKHRISLPCTSFHGCALSVKPLISQGQCRFSRAASWTSPTNEVAVDGSANAVAVPVTKLDVAAPEDVTKDPPTPAKEASISAVMADVANLIKLVDSRDIVELELKHLDYELVIRKKEALPPPPTTPSFAPPQVIAQAQYPPYAPPPPPPMSAPAPATAPAQASPPPAAPVLSPGSDVPCILSPMAGTFYKCPAPGEPAFVKVGDKVQKGQVICIVEAMKLMNEIEADQSGTVVEILAEDGKPVSVDTPLFAIKA
ncbi:hypothetical protein GOP47_0018622 [Adiantum capillus-veneris]|uniref:Biotin carboxyl carrier protein of acetyl-CoA carboxylase n=1 Tax=Adiantum capillus-veneris TaxID=13818 RepID=A0A9D4UDI5_ADICA|nr:hypothetical protein GOP47_0018622 [Adiantum capillus-veneris]